MRWFQRRRKPPLSAAAKESLAILMVGDGVIAALMPRRHVMLWSFGPDWWTGFVRAASERPWAIRASALVAAGTGLWWAWRLAESRSPR
jgi:hypothetical protein